MSARGFYAVVMASRAAAKINLESSMSSKHRQEKAYNSSIARAMRRKNPENHSTPVTEMKKEYQKNTALLSFLLMAYMFSQDDDVIDRKEEKAIKRTLKKFNPILSEDDINIILKFSNDKPNKAYVMNYISETGASKGLFDDARKEIRDLVKKNDAYRKLIRAIHDEMMFNV